jgi:hypothetical protein
MVKIAQELIKGRRLNVGASLRDEIFGLKVNEGEEGRSHAVNELHLGSKFLFHMCELLGWLHKSGLSC